MENCRGTIQSSIETIRGMVGSENQLIVKEILIGKDGAKEACIVYMNGLANKEMIDRDVLKPLMIYFNEDLSKVADAGEYLCKRYITMSNSCVERDMNAVADALKRGKCIILIDEYEKCIIVDTVGGVHRNIEEPLNELSIKGTRESFVENLEVNVSMLKRRIKDRNLVTENFKVGRRSQTDLVMMYISDIADDKLLDDVRRRIETIDIDSATSSGILEQCIEKHSFSMFPQVFTTERPDTIQANLMEGRIAILLDGNPVVLSVPALFIEFFQPAEDYYNRTLIGTFSRIVRYMAVIMVITLPGIYITLVKFNPELIPLEYIRSIVESRKGIVLTPVMSILAMNLAVEFLREGGLRLPGKIGQTLSVVGGIIIGDAAMKAKIVSPSTLLVIGITTIATFLIPTYEMSLSIRVLSIPMTLLANWLGMLGVSAGWFFIISYLCSMDSFGVPYFTFHKKDMKDTLVRAPVWMMKERPEGIPHKDRIRQKNSRGGNNEE